MLIESGADVNAAMYFYPCSGIDIPKVRQLQLTTV